MARNDVDDHGSSTQTADDERDGSNRQRFARRLRELRTAEGISQERLAERAGLHRNYVGAIERGERNPGLDAIHALADGLRVSPSDLFT